MKREETGFLLEINDQDSNRADELNVERPNLPEQPLFRFWSTLFYLLQNIVSTPDPGSKDTERKS